MNRLRDEPSLYLRQHADNPVDWWPWCDEALAAASEQNKPILLSIGYSACHWCHVMAHESFEDTRIAGLMNTLFINIKVDREQRPDLDKLYQTAHQLMLQRPGGWPLTMFLTPDEQLPFFGGTYFPPTARQGMPGFDTVLSKVAEFHSADPAEAARQGGAVRDVFDKLQPALVDTGEAIDAEGPIEALRAVNEQHFDAEHGGFGRAPKFPQAPTLLRLLNHWRATTSDAEPDLQSLYRCALSLTRMVRGGLFDQVEGGFFRYCVDREWKIPHFEKMLYDNGLLLEVLAAAHQASGDPLFAFAARQTGEWLLRDMRDDAGGFYATLDADSTDGEGAYYTYSSEEFEAALGDDTALAKRAFGLDGPANFEARWHLQMALSAAELSETERMTEQDAGQTLARLRDRLAALRQSRPRPGRDEKVLTAWNALAIKGLAIAGRVLDDAALTGAALSAVDFADQHLRDGDRLHSGWHHGTALGPGYLDDYAMLADALLETLQSEWRSDRLDWCIRLADSLLAHFHDDARGGFFFTAHDHEALIYRQKPLGDDALPAGNAIAVRVLMRLGALLGETRYLDAAEAALRYAAPAVEEFPQAHVALIEALAERAAGVETIVLRGDPAITRQWQHSIQRIYAPHRLVFAIDGGDEGLPPALAAHAAPTADQRALAYICQGTRCLAAVDNWRELASAIRER